MRTRYEVWYDGWNGEDNPHIYVTFDAEQAAWSFWRDLCDGDPGYFKGCDECEPVHVRDPGGVVRKFAIDVEMEPVISTKEL